MYSEKNNQPRTLHGLEVLEKVFPEVCKQLGVERFVFKKKPIFTHGQAGQENLTELRHTKAYVFSVGQEKYALTLAKRWRTPSLMPGTKVIGPYPLPKLVAALCCTPLNSCCWYHSIQELAVKHELLIVDRACNIFGTWHGWGIGYRHPKWPDMSSIMKTIKLREAEESTMAMDNGGYVIGSFATYYANLVSLLATNLVWLLQSGS